MIQRTVSILLRKGECNGYTVFGLNRRTNRCWLDTVGYCHTSAASITMGVSWVKPSVMSMWPERVFKRVS